MAMQWQKLSPAQFQQLQDYCSYSSTKVKDVMKEFSGNGVLSRYNPDQPIDYNGFILFMKTYLELNELPEELCKSLFQSFMKSGKCCNSSNSYSTDVASQTICVPLAHSSTDLLHLVGTDKADRYHGLLAEKFHDLTERIHGLGHSSGEKLYQHRKREHQHFEAINSVGILCSKTGTNAQGTQGSILIKDVVCYLSLVEGGGPEEKLEFMFRLYDSDNNGYLDSNEIDCIISQMMSVAEYLGWDVSELKPILQDMMKEIDFDSDGRVTLEEWKKGGLTTIPLLVLLGLDANVKDDGTHCWYLKHFRSQMHCNMCQSMLSGMGKKGLCCQFCKYIVHERCVQKAPANCIMTYVKSKKSIQDMQHFWIDGNCTQKCDKCKKSIKSGINGKTCRWCKAVYHDKCATSVKQECDLGEFRDHILPPTSIVPAVLHQSSFQIDPVPGTHPLLVFINPKSGGKQGEKMFQKFQYMLNPRQVYNLTKGGPKPGLQFFKEVKNARVLVCGGDGTVGWILDAMDKLEMETRIPVAVLPLGTGNDLARCLNWGPGYEGESLEKIIHSLEKSSVAMLDRWSIDVEDNGGEEPGDAVPLNIINNYFSIGVDASICHRFHTMREKHPEKFNSRIKNKMWYFEFGTSETFSATCKNLHETIEVSSEGFSLEINKGPGLEGIAMLNIPTIYGGANLWGENVSKKQRQKLLKSVKKKKDQNPFPQSKLELQAAITDIGDKLFEVAGVENSLHAGMVSGKVRSGNRLAQTAALVLKTTKRVPMQIDGEPWVQNPCTITIKHKNQVPMLVGPKEKAGGGLLKIFR